MRRLIAAGAGVLALFLGILLHTTLCALPAHAADLADLEGRIAELEATTARSANRRLQVSLYGQVNRALLFWDDGFDGGTFIVDNHTSSSRFGFTGQAVVKPGWTAGFRLEFEAAFPSSHEVFNGPGDSDGLVEGSFASALRIRQSYWDIASHDHGRVAVGYQSPATDDITIINLGSQMNDAAVHYNSAFRVRLDLAKPFITTDLTWGEIAHNVDSLRGYFLRYDTPILAGFLLSTAFNDDVWDVALRYQNGADRFRFAAGFGYMKDAREFGDAMPRQRPFEDLKGSASLIHNPTGLYVSVAGGWRNAAVEVPAAGDQARFHYAQLGISKQWFAAGKTAVYVDHGVYRNFNTGEILSINPQTKDEVQWGTLVDTQVRRWGFGLEQAVDAANMLLYAQAHLYDPSIVGFPCTFDDPKDPKLCAGDPSKTSKLPAASWQGFVMGARIQF
jgi:Gram-negative porin